MGRLIFILLIFCGSLNAQLLSSNDGLLKYTPQYTTESLAFFAANTGLTDNEKFAVNELVRGLKRLNMWTSAVGIYPFIGGTASAHKWNLKNIDTLTFVGTCTHSYLGTLFGANGYAITKINGASHLNLTYNVLAVYCQNNVVSAAETNALIGAYSAATSQVSLRKGIVAGDNILTYYHANSTNNNGNIRGSATAPNSLYGFVCAYKNISGRRIKYNGYTVVTNTVTTDYGALPNKFVWISNAEGVTNSFAEILCSFAYVGNNNMSDAVAVEFYELVRYYQRLLNREAQ